MSTDYTIEDIEEQPFAKVEVNGENRRAYQPNDVWELDLNLFVKKVDPTDYFVTTGEATLKARKLEADLFAMAGRARKLVNILLKLKGDNVYLETSWQEGRLLIKTKNPRKNIEEKVKALEENFDAKLNHDS